MQQPQCFTARAALADFSNAYRTQHHVYHEAEAWAQVAKTSYGLGVTRTRYKLQAGLHRRNGWRLRHGRNQADKPPRNRQYARPRAPSKRNVLPPRHPQHPISL
jgi:hypothetical protein